MFELIRSIWNDVLEHPLLQYIPLNKRSVIIKKNGAGNVGGGKPKIYLFDKPTDLQPMLRTLGLPEETLNAINWKTELPMMTLNFVAQQMRYRTSKIGVLGAESEGYMELFTTNRGYIYRDGVFFVAYDEHGKRLVNATRVYHVTRCKKY